MALLSPCSRAALLGAAFVLGQSPASAWIETTLLSDAVTVEVNVQGQAIVAHDLWLRIRGGPLKGTELDGIDADAEPLPDAQVIKKSNGNVSEQTKPLLLSRGDDDTLHIEVEDPVGLRNGTYAFQFRYRTDFRQLAHIAQRGAWAELGWVGPRYRAGLDVAKVTFRLPHAPMSSRLPETDPTAEGLSQGELPTSAMLSTLRRGADTDELELLRPHVARGEPVLWRVWAAPDSFPWFAETRREKAATLTAVGHESPRSPLGRGIALAFSGLLALTASALVFSKHRTVTREAKRQLTTARALIAIPVFVRAILAGLLTGLAILLPIRADAPSLGAVSLALAFAFMLYRKPIESRTLRGPGRWLPLQRQDAFRCEAGTVARSYLDASTNQGKAVLLVWLSLTLGIGCWLFRSQPYLAMLTFMSSVMPLPLWLTGCISELPEAMRERTGRELKRMAKLLDGDGRWRVSTIGRFAGNDMLPDEIRLKVTASELPRFIVGLEIASVAHASEPNLCLIVRCRDDVETSVQCGSGWSSSRGRTPDERVHLFAPSVASRSRIVAQLDRLLDLESNARHRHQSDDDAYSSRARRSSSKSAGNGSETSKPPKSRVPFHATRAA
ncbi:MAG TPA: hypothetical protein VIV60_31330 [Polyangiaceae bacterium]